MNSRVQCDDASLGLAFAPFCPEGYRKVILPVVQGQPAVLVTVGQLLGHAEVSEDGVVGAAAGDCRLGYVATLSGVLAAAEADLGVGFVEAFASGLGLGQLPVGLFTSGNGTAGVPHCDALDLVGCCPQPFRCGVDDRGLTFFQLAGAGFTEMGDGLVVAPPCCVKPEFQCRPLDRCGIESYPFRFGFGSGGVRGADN